MAVGPPFASIVAAVAAVGAVYEAARYYSAHHHSLQQHRQGLHYNDEADLKNKQMKTYKVTEMAVPKFAPEFDGLHCFETFVIH